ncbi:MAG: asparaginase [Armatimonadota bacterium]
MEPIPLAHVTRGVLVESVHYGSAAVADAEGRLRAALGDPDRRYYLRSSSKPLQAILVITSGAADQFAFTTEELAITCASHHGTARHVEVVLGILDKLGLGPEALQCGTHAVSDAEERERLAREGLGPSPLHNNCSGKHAGMLAACQALGLPIDDYIKPTHPLQKAHLANVALFCSLPEAEVVIGVDGCGVPTFGVPLRAAATAYARLASGVGLPEEAAAATRRVREAVWQAPHMISAPGAFNSELLATCRGRLIAKGGAEGLFCAGETASAEGLAMKTEDGLGRGLVEAVTAALAVRWPSLPCEAFERWRTTRVTNCRGEHVGNVTPVFPVGALVP